MADPFEVRLRFTYLLSHLTASTTSQLKAAQYALKHSSLSEDLHSCILENLEQPPQTQNMNNAANVMYFLEHHADVNLKEGGHAGYIEMVRRDIQRIVGAVARSGANVKVVRRVVTSLGERGVLEPTIVQQIEEGLKEREADMGRMLGEREANEGQVDPADPDTIAQPMDGVETNSTPREKKDAKSKTSLADRDKRAIEQRIEEDRERNKRLREGVWAVSGDDEGEMSRMWEDDGVLVRDDRVIASEELEERVLFGRYHRGMVVGA
jgi:CTD kinase subunit gamma